jgi:hypothetical protein
MPLRPNAKDTLTDMEGVLSSGRAGFLLARVGGLGLWSAGWVAARRAVRDAGQTDMRGFGVAAGLGSSWGAAV